MNLDLDRDEVLSAAGLCPARRRVPIPIGPQDVATVFDQALAQKPDAVAVVGRHGRLTFAELEQQVNAAAAFLTELGLRPGDRIAASLGNHSEIVVAFLAVQRLGAIWVGINCNYGLGEKRHFLNDAQVSIFLGDRVAVEQVSGLRPEVPSLRILVGMEPGEAESEWALGLRRHAGAGRPVAAIDPWAPAGIAYTSGTTGLPKGAVHSQHNMMVAATIGELVARDQRPDRVRGVASPLTILNFMILGPLSSLSRGNRVVCMDRTDAAGIAEWVGREKITVFNTVPTIILDLFTRPDIDQSQLDSITGLVAGGAMVPENVAALYRERFGHRLTIGYGLTEQPTAVSRSHDGTPAVQGAIGRPLPHLEVAILDTAGNALPPGSSGEICVRAAREGPWAGVYTPALGYWNRPEATAGLLVGGWMHTGDIGYRDEAGELYIQDRRNDLILRGGANIYPAEVERVLRMDPRIADCAVVGKPDERLGQVPAAFVQPLASADAEGLVEELKALCAREIARYKIPVEWHVMTEMPRNGAGKVVKPRLLELLAAEGNGAEIRR